MSPLTPVQEALAAPRGWPEFSPAGLGVAEGEDGVGVEALETIVLVGLEQMVCVPW